MAAQLRELRSRIKATKSIGKITKAMELIATARITKARAKVAASRPYADEITKVLSALAGAAANLDHPMLVERPNPKRAAVLVVTSDKGQCGGYNSNVLRATEELLALLRSEGKEPQVYVTGNKGLNYYRFRNRPVEDSWTGFSDQPTYAGAVAAGEALVQSFMAGVDDEHGDTDGITGVDEIHIVYTEFVSMLTQRPTAKRVAPLEVEYSEGEEEKPAGLLPSYEFEPSADKLLDALLPKYINTRLYAAFLESAASELAARRTAMKAASDNANDLVGNLTREMNQARQAQITQEISEIVGGANALTAAGSDD
ncbi:F-type H+-transporting ATPase subunit gamma [Amycolatopsis mediterranei S699]|uniref:ATP synthase gamma chain n=2 Tax=Amycolatopsis mediterranei TaxID=33910 RepID=A0A0H3DII3_AMYMU|nr:F0F1 ATP synthase subunit gamma [Amycolatopsis mediterranei]ADJ49484.1 F-type H+-transporting ATPase subunit gamma [Amycolatopsis mediterranei U32]AEK46456.1 F-type H+-transporting ATPase subunit gamma [Amycolatopsis mediterranei S699]AFO81192.1 F-type H+-transporting ATPase subunit gamma [Amycolatopsis mediterranei S699]AGT88320.1 F-type H+-transporting ATPase subunit gamma [Amycolatopsis mediterranei RB]KDO12702.1 ATP synthase F0F1 subunit gamma [Amycolatopsis mediterranei]